MDEARRERLRALPSIDELLGRASLRPVLAPWPRAVTVRALREAVEGVRQRVLAGEVTEFSDDDVVRALARVTQPSLRPVINATGVVLHTNLGRAPLAARALERVTQVARGYCNLELDLDEGERGSRYAHVVDLLTSLTGAEDALVVNNCAAAVLLTFGALAGGREAIVSRGELVEIGGGFRIPDVMRQSGAQLVEVGTTNRTRLEDFRRARTPNTGLVVKVHQSNFSIDGFTESVSVAELATLEVPLFVDLGSGALTPLSGPGLPSEATVSSVVAAGADVVAFSGDKLLGGPQAGILVGKGATIAQLARHPLNRALRVDKLTVAALEATLELYRDGLEAEVPARAMLTVSADVLRARAVRLGRALDELQVAHRLVDVEGRAGGGTLPKSQLPGVAVAVQGPGAALHEALRQGTPAVVGRVVDDELWLDVRCVKEEDLPELARAVAGARKST